MTCVKQTYLESSKNGIYVHRLLTKIISTALSDTLKLFIDNFLIEQVSCVKSLGVYIDENLVWHFHIDKLCKKPDRFCN